MKYFQLLKNIIYVTTVFIVSSCSKNKEVYDITGDAVNRIYLNTSSIKHNLFESKITITPISVSGSAKASFFARSTQVASKDVSVTFSIDNSLVKAYNLKDSTKTFSKVPLELVSIPNDKLVIPKGKIISMDSITVSIPSDRISKLTKSNYILPIKISSISQNEDFATSSNQSVVYMAITISHKNVYDNATAGNIKGTIISDRSAWVGTSHLANSGILFDGDVSYPSGGDYFRSNQTKLKVDLGRVYNHISAIRVQPLHLGDNYYPVQSAEVFTSIDGTSWKSQGLAKMNNTGFIKFYEAIPSVKYIKLKFEISNFAYLVEFNLYQSK